MTKRSYRTKIRRYRNKKEAIKRKGNKCQNCNWTGHISGFAFHHPDPSQKEFGLSGTNSPTKWETYWKEAEKCILLCATCHTILHSDGNDPQFLKDVEEYEGRDLIESDICWKNKTQFKKNVKKYCKQCNSEFIQKSKSQKFCSVICKGLNLRKVIRPSKEMLFQLIENYSMVDIGKQFGVTDNTIRKWIKYYNKSII